MFGNDLLPVALHVFPRIVKSILRNGVTAAGMPNQSPDVVHFVLSFDFALV